MLIIMNISVVLANSIQDICIDMVGQGIIQVRYSTTKNNMKLKVLIEKDKQKYSYNIDGTNQYESFGLQMGNGIYNYLSDLDRVLTEKKGICYDIASLMAAMLRIQQIPTKLVMGYQSQIHTYHSWIEVYNTGKNIWEIIDPVYDLSIKKNQSQIAMIKDGKHYKKEKEY